MSWLFLPHPTLLSTSLSVFLFSSSVLYPSLSFSCALRSWSLITLINFASDCPTMLVFCVMDVSLTMKKLHVTESKKYSDFTSLCPKIRYQNTWYLTCWVHLCVYHDKFCVLSEPDFRVCTHTTVKIHTFGHFLKEPDDHVRRILSCNIEENTNVTKFAVFPPNHFMY